MTMTIVLLPASPDFGGGEWRGEQRENCMSMSAMGQKTATDYFVQNMQRWG